MITDLPIVGQSCGESVAVGREHGFSTQLQVLSYDVEFGHHHHVVDVAQGPLNAVFPRLGPVQAMAGAGVLRRSDSDAVASELKTLPRQASREATNFLPP